MSSFVQENGVLEVWQHLGGERFEEIKQLGAPHFRISRA
jgi:hypothetical protein